MALQGLSVQAGLRHSIGTKIFVAFFAMSAIIGALGAYGYRVLAVRRRHGDAAPMTAR